MPLNGTHDKHLYRHHNDKLDDTGVQEERGRNTPPLPAVGCCRLIGEIPVCNDGPANLPQYAREETR